MAPRWTCPNLLKQCNLNIRNPMTGGRRAIQGCITSGRLSGQRGGSLNVQRYSEAPPRLNHPPLSRPYCPEEGLAKRLEELEAEASPSLSHASSSSSLHASRLLFRSSSRQAHRARHDPRGRLGMPSYAPPDKPAGLRWARIEVDETHRPSLRHPSAVPGLRELV